MAPRTELDRKVEGEIHTSEVAVNDWGGDGGSAGVCMTEQKKGSYRESWFWLVEE